MPVINHFNTAELKSGTDGNFVWLPVEKQKMFLDVALRIADKAVEGKFGKLEVKDVEVYQSLKDENEARFLEFLGGKND